MAPSLDSSKSNCNRPCGYLTAVGPVVNGGTVTRGYARIFCKKWSCPFCGPWKAKQFTKRVAEEAKAHGLSRFLTLTLDPSKLEPGDDAVKHLKKTWRKFRVYLKRKFKRSVSFIAVMEYHKSGVPHMHVLVDRFIKQSWISANWSRLGGGRIVDIRYVADLETVGWYIGKYLSKDGILRVPKGVRRYSTSQDIKLFPKVETEGWSISQTDLDDLYRLHQHDATGEVRLLTGELRSFRVPVPLDVGFDYPLDYWRPYDPERDELPLELKDTKLEFTIIGVGNEAFEGIEEAA